MIKTILGMAVALIFSSSIAEARHHIVHHHYRHHVRIAHSYAVDPGCNVIFPCAGVETSKRGTYIAERTNFGAAVQHYVPATVELPRQRYRRIAHRAPNYGAPSISVGYSVTHAVSRVAEVIGGRPSGCPHAYCGCSASLKVFGRIVPNLNLAANWLKFPRAAPASGMVAARHGHVFVIVAVNSDGTVVAHDGNSGRGLTRIHTVSLRGYTVVDPHG